MNTDINILVIGLGSMGKRRIRNLRQLGYKNIFGFDTRHDRLTETESLYGINQVSNLATALAHISFTAMVISVPPDSHVRYMQVAINHNIHFFVEASVVDNGLEDIIKHLTNKGLIAAPSATLYFHPAVKYIYSVVAGGELGSLTNFVYHSGQFLPDWHTYEQVAEYYVSKKETGGAREIVPFELTWITKLLGFPKAVSALVKKTISIEGAEAIDDTYNALLDYEGLIVNLTVDVVSRQATRRLLINGSEKQLLWNWEDNAVRIFDPRLDSWSSWDYKVNSSAAGYNKNITEQMYLDELVNFFDAVNGKCDFFNSLQYDYQVLKVLYAIERSSELGSRQEIGK